MPFSHYPKEPAPYLGAWIFPVPPEPPVDEDNFTDEPPVSEYNLIKGDTDLATPPVLYHDAMPFTRFLGTIDADVPLTVEFSFSNEGRGPDGRLVDDEALPKLNYRPVSTCRFDPKTPESGKMLVTIYGRWLRVAVRHGGTPPTRMAVHLLGSVF